ncbi:MAG: hypothetical protein AAB534_03150 [Patescibacteria group bacterium]
MSKLHVRITKGRFLNPPLFLLITFTLLTVISFLPIFNLEQQVEAAPSETTLYGQAWSDNIGWVSFNNCPTEGSENCGAVDYSVKVNNKTGLMSGSAWSDNIGWIKFDGLSGFPSTDQGSNALIKFNGSEEGKVEGWVRACAGTASGNCSSMTSRTDGWDGWISLSNKTNYPSPQFSGTGGVTYDEEIKKLVGSAWGSDVVGWINFYNVSFGPPEDEDFDYDLSNTSPDYELEIEQGNTGNISVDRELLAGMTQESITLSVVSGAGSPVTITIVSNNPCSISWLNPNCASSVTIEVEPEASTGQYEFTIGGVSSLSEIVRTTEVKFKVIPPIPDPEVSCDVDEVVFYPGQTVTYQATITNPIGDEEFLWSDAETDSCLSDICEVSYSTIGPKKPKVSINNGVSFSDCPIVNIIPRVFQMLEF